MQKTAQAEWYRLRAQRHHDFFVSLNDGMPIFTWNIEQQKQHDLMLRYLTATERKFQREHSQLNQHYKTKLLEAKLAADDDDDDDDKEEPIPPGVLDLTFQNNDTGQVLHLDGTIDPPPPDYVPEKIIPGVFGPLRPSNMKRFAI